jgi:hypothetical protein
MVGSTFLPISQIRVAAGAVEQTKWRRMPARVKHGAHTASPDGRILRTMRKLLRIQGEGGALERASRIVPATNATPDSTG